MAVNEQIPQEGQQSGLSRQCNNLVKSSNIKSSDEEEDDGTTCKICKVSWVELTEKCGDVVQYICQKCYGKRDISGDDDFTCSIYIGQ